MRTNLYGEFVIEVEDYDAFLQSDLDRQRFIKIEPNLSTDHGVIINGSISKTGIYFIYKLINEKNTPLYVGYTTSSIHQRIGRYFAAARGTQRIDENHPGGEKHKLELGLDFENMSMKFLHYDFSTLHDNITPLDIEDWFIKKLQPIFNNQNYINLKFEKEIKIINIKAA